MKIVIGTSPGEVTLARWRAEFPQVEFAVPMGPAEGVAAARDADAWIGRIPREAFLAAGPGLRWVHSTGAGIETLAAIPELVESEVTVTNTRGGHAPTIADHTFALLLSLARKLPALQADQREHVWAGAGSRVGMRQLGGMTMTIVGFGNIGRAIGKRAVAFDMRVRGVDPFPGETPPGVEAVWPLDRLDEALAETAALVVAAPLTPQTRGLIDARRIGLLPPGAYLIAISRGGIVEEAPLIDALAAGRLAGAGLDVTATEPLPPDDPLWDAPNLILTPHCSGASRQTTERVWELTTENVRHFVAGRPLTNICDKRAGF